MRIAQASRNELRDQCPISAPSARLSHPRALRTPASALLGIEGARIHA